MRFPVTEPHLDDADRSHLMAAFDSGWISSQGEFLKRFEADFAEFTGTRHAVAVCNGTAGLHATLLALGVGPGDEVIVPTFTYVATVNAVHNCGATPVLIDCEPDTWNMDPKWVAAAVTPRTKGIIPVHLYGHPCDMTRLEDLAREHGLWLLEDAAEAHGAEIDGRCVGAIGRAAVFSLYGNKIVTTGEGGVVTTDDDGLAEEIRLICGQGMDPGRRYWFPRVGYNYRMTNLAAAIGVAQLAKVDRLIEAHRRIAGWYRTELEGIPEIVLPVERPGCRNVYWLYSARFVAAEREPELRDALMTRLAGDGIDTRPFFYPMHQMPVYRQFGHFGCADRIAASGINLPSSPRLTGEDVRFIAGRLLHHVAELSPGIQPTISAPVPGSFASGPSGGHS